jgi:DNA-binding MarR family transcriptional regulator
MAVNMSDAKTGPNPLFLMEEELRTGLELLYFAQRDVAAAADDLLAAHGLGRAHQRVIYFVGRHPRISVGDLLTLLKITKQSLSRVLAPLLREGYVAQRPGAADRRQRLLSLTEKGADLERRIWEIQGRRIARAYRQAGAEAVEGFRTVLAGMTDEAAARRRKPGG